MKLNKIIALILILLFGAFLRFIHLDYESLADAEIITSCEVNKTLPDLLLNRVSKGHAPFYFIIMHYWVKIFGNTKFALRIFSCLVGILSIYLLFYVARIFCNEEAALISSFIFSASLINVSYAQQAELYCLLEFFVLISTLFLFSALRNNKIINWILFGLAVLASFYTNHVAILMFLSIIIYIFLYYWKNKKTFIRFIICTAVIIFLYLPFLFILIKFRIPGLLLWNKRPNIYWLSETILFFSNELLTVTFTFLLYILLFIYGTYKLRYKKELKLLYLLLFITVFAPFLFSFLIKESISGQFRWILYTSIPYYIIIANGIEALRSKKLKAVCLLIIFLSGSLIFWNRQVKGLHFKTRLEEAESFLNQNISGEDIIFDFQAGVFGKYCKSYNYNIIHLNNSSFIKYLKDNKNIWFVLCNYRIETKYNNILNQIDSSMRSLNYKKMLVKEFSAARLLDENKYDFGLIIYHYQKL